MRFVIQQHIAKDEHFDLMTETEGLDTLLTWKIAKGDMDLLVKGNIVKAERLAEHRKEYLIYEGLLSKGRGSVKIFDSGDCSTVFNENNKIVFKLDGKKLAGNIFLDRIDNKMFTIRYASKMKRQN